MQEECEVRGSESGPVKGVDLSRYRVCAYIMSFSEHILGYLPKVRGVTKLARLVSLCLPGTDKVHKVSIIPVV